MVDSKQLLRVTVAVALVVVVGIAASLRGAVLVEQGLRRHLAGDEGQRLRVGTLRVNPLTRTVALDDLSVETTDGSRPLRVDAARASLSGGLLFGGDLAVRELIVNGFAIDLRPGPDGQPAWGAHLAAPGENAPGLRLERLEMDDGVVHLRTATGTTVPDMTAREVALVLEEVATGSGASSRVELRARIDGPPAATGPATAPGSSDGAAVADESAGRRLAAAGHYDLHARRGRFDLTLEAVWLAPLLAVFAPDEAPGRPDGTLSGAGRLALDGVSAHFEGALALRGLKIEDAPGAAGLRAAEASSDAVVVRNRPLRVRTAALSLREPELALRLGATGDGEWSRWTTIFAPGNARAALATPVLSIEGGRVEITDLRPAEPVNWVLRDVAGVVRLDEGPSAPATPPAASRAALAVRASARIEPAGSLDLDARVDPGSPLGNGVGQWTIDEVAASTLAPYAAGLTARTLASGTLRLQSAYRVQNGRRTVAGMLIADRLEFGAEGPDDAPVPAADLDLARALLTDAAGRARLSVAAAGPPSARGGQVWREALASAVRAVARDAPRELARLVAAAERELSPDPAVVPDAPASTASPPPAAEPWARAPTRVAFGVGDASLDKSARRQLAVVSRVLENRPLLGLVVQAPPPAPGDRAALARRQLLLHVTLATSARPTPAGVAEPLDFADPKVHAVLDEFSGLRLAPGARAALAAMRKSLAAANDREATARYYEAVYEALAAVETVSPRALRQLGRYRAQAIVAQLGRSGIDPSRLQTAPPPDGNDAAGNAAAELLPFAAVAPAT